MKFSGIFRTPTTHVLVICRSRKMEVSLITEENKCVVRQAQKRFTCILTSNKIAWIKFLNHSQFVGMKNHFFMEDSSHRTSRQPKVDACLRADRRRDLKTDCLLASMFWSDFAVCGRPGLFSLRHPFP